MEQRGVINYPNRAMQLRDFSGLVYGTITPTDIDGFIDYHDKAFIFFELKLQGTPIKIGQRLALERLVIASLKSGRYSIGIIAEHNTPSDYAIDVANCIVTETKQQQEWKPVTKPHTVKQVIDIFMNTYFPSEFIPPQNENFSDEEIDKIIIDIDSQRSGVKV